MIHHEPVYTAILYLSGPFGDFSDIESSIRNRMDDFEFFFYCNIFIKWIRSNLGWADSWFVKSHKSITLTVYKRKMFVKVEKYSTTLETLLFTQDLDPNILDVFHQFVALRM